jgi:uncharacterized membrane protein
MASGPGYDGRVPLRFRYSRRAVVRVALAVASGVLAYLAVALRYSAPAAAFIAWDVAGVVLLGISWSVVLRASPRETRTHASGEDPGRTLVYVVVLLTSAVSLLAATVLVRSARSLMPEMREAAVVLCLVSVALSWAMTHTAFTFRYAHLYYREDADGTGGITIPGDDAPCFLDFAYFAFTIGMCFQVSDMSVTSRPIRSAVLLHAVMSFAYNTVILAFVLNLAFGVAA